MRRTRNKQETTALPAEPVPGTLTPFGQAEPQSWLGQAAPPAQFGRPFQAAHPGQGGLGVQSFAGTQQPFGQQIDAQPLGAETVVARVRRHGRKLVLPVLMLFLVVGFGGFFIGSLPETWMNLVAFAGALLLMVFVGIGPILGWLARRVVITNRRVIVHHGFFVRHRGEVSLARVREVRSRQNLVQRMWGSGDIDLYVGAEPTRIPDAPGAKELHAALQELSERSYDEQVRASAFGA